MLVLLRMYFYKVTVELTERGKAPRSLEILVAMEGSSDPSIVALRYLGEISGVKEIIKTECITESEFVPLFEKQSNEFYSFKIGQKE